jgi:hypothetical protein
MAISLMYALLDVTDNVDLQRVVRVVPNMRADRYRDLRPNQRTRVQEAVYDAFYSILETQKIDYIGGGRGFRASEGVGGALARVISRDMSPMSVDETNNIAGLKQVLQDVIDQAIDNILNP